jgi:glutamate synthase (NADPH/NADH) small chain
VAREVAHILAADVPVHTQQALGRDFSLDDLLDRDFEAVFLATGLPGSVDGSLPGSDGPQVVQALEYLQQHALGGAPLAGPNVVVVGGGNTAVDAAVCAKLAEARDVYLVYRRSFGQMPAWHEDRQRAVDAGVHALVLVRPVECVRDQNSSLTGVKCVRTELTEPSVGDQRREPVDLPDTEFVLPANLLILAIGQHLGADLQNALAGLRFNPDGSVWTDPETRATSRPNVYAGGDLTNTDHTVVHALADGLRAADAIAKSLRSEARAP